MTDLKFYKIVCKTQEYKNNVKELQQRIEKAIEYIEFHNNLANNNFSMMHYDEELLKILKGEEK